MSNPLPQMPFPSGGETHTQSVSLDIAGSWEPLLTRACELKEAVDHVLRWPSESMDQDWIAQCFAANDLRPEDAMTVHGKCQFNFPDHFASTLLGGWIGRLSFDSQRPVGWCLIPPWAVLGWVRKDSYQTTPELPEGDLERKAATVDAWLQSDTPTTAGIEGIPLLWAGEGKNRTQLFRLAKRPRVSLLWLYPRPRIEQCRVRRLRLFRSIAVLEYRSGAKDILPFGNLSIDLLKAVGVREYGRPSLLALWTLFAELHSLHGLKEAARIMVAGASAASFALLKKSR